MESDSERSFYHVVIRLTLLGAAFGTLMALFSRWFWVAELFSHFRLYYLLALILLALTFLWTSHRYLLALSLILALPNAWYVWPYLSPLPAAAQAAQPESSGLFIIAHNLRAGSREFEPTLAYLQRSDADILVLAEYTRGWATALASLDELYPYRVTEPRAHPWGLAIYSRVPLTDLERVELAPGDNVQFRATLSINNEPVELFAVHLFSPVRLGFASRRNEQLRTLAALVRAAEHPAIVVGDLNITPFSPHFASLLDDAGLVDVRQRWGFHFTWPTAPLPLWIPIDHCLADVRVDVADVRRGPNVGSDHYPLEIYVGRSPAATRI